MSHETPQLQPQKNLDYVNNLRILACFMVITLHCSAKFWYIVPMGEADWLLVTTFNSLVRCAVSIFFMISGLLFLNPEKNFSIKQLYSKNIARIVVAFVFWSFFYYQMNPPAQGHSTQEMAISLLYGHYHLGFLYSLVGMYILIPLLRPIAEKKELMEYFLLLNFIFVPFVTAIRSFPVWDDIVETLAQKSQFYFVLGYPGFFILGSYLQRFPLVKWKRCLLYLATMFSYIITIYGTYWISMEKGQPNETFFRYFLPTTYCAGIGIYVFIQHFRLPPSAVKIMKHIAPLTFGVYLLHDYFLTYFLLDLGWIDWEISPLYSIPWTVCAVFFSALPLVFLLRKIPIIGKWIV